MKFLFILTIFLILTPFISSHALAVDVSLHSFKCDLNFSQGANEVFRSAGDCGKQSTPIGFGLGSFGAISRFLLGGID